MKNIISYLTGLLFATGLGISGMTQPHVVRAFLDIFGKWNWSLMGVMIGAIGTHMIAFRYIVKRPTPVLETKFFLPEKILIDRKLILGAVIFGFGWGWAGVCPGPGIVSLFSGDLSFFFFLAAMLLGMKVFQLVERKL